MKHEILEPWTCPVEQTLMSCLHGDSFLQAKKDLTTAKNVMRYVIKLIIWKEFLIYNFIQNDLQKISHVRTKSMQMGNNYKCYIIHEQ